MPVAIKFGTKTEKIEQKENLLKRWRRNLYKTVEVDYYQQPKSGQNNQLNYQMKTIKNFYHELYPMQFEEPLFTFT
jgi:molecular chaperone HtpG